jgi:hypothetical protein
VTAAPRAVREIDLGKCMMRAFPMTERDQFERAAIPTVVRLVHPSPLDHIISMPAKAERRLRRSSAFSTAHPPEGGAART